MNDGTPLLLLMVLMVFGGSGVYYWVIKHKELLGEGRLEKVAVRDPANQRVSKRQADVLSGRSQEEESKRYRTPGLVATKVYLSGRGDPLVLTGRVEVPYPEGTRIRVYRCFGKYRFEQAK